MSEVKVNKISPRTNCGTVTLGDSGDSFVIPAGATITNNGTQTGFGREGSVDWQTGSIKTAATFTAASGEGYFVDTSSNQVTANLPAGSAGAIVAFSDYARNFATNVLIVSPNGSEKIGGVAANATLNINGQASTFVYVDSTKGWINVQNAEDTESGSSFITATGGTITECGDYKIHTFTGPGTFCVSAISTAPADNTIDYLVVAGGAAGGGTAAFGGTNGSGGGAGGVRFFANPSNNPQGGPAAPRNAPAGVTITASPFPITVGAGGAAATCLGNSGNPSIFSSITSTGGGGGGAASSPLSPTEYGKPGGSGGGASGGPQGNFGAGNTPPVSPPQGEPGGNPSPSSAKDSGAGGGFMQAGTGPRAGGAGGGFQGFGPGGVPCGSYRYFGGGGGGAGEPSGDAQPGGLGGGGAGGYPAPSGPASSGTAGTANTGGGGGGGTFVDCSTGGGGGSGIVVIRYKFQ